MEWTFMDFVKVTLMAALCVAVIVAIKLIPTYLG